MSNDSTQIPTDAASPVAPSPTSENVDLESRVLLLEERCAELEKKSVQSGRGLFLSVIAIYAVFVSLLILHWAGHLMRHPA